MKWNRAFCLELLETRNLLSGGASSLLAADSSENDTNPLKAILHSTGCSCPVCDGSLASSPVEATGQTLNASSPQIVFLDFDGATVTSNPFGFGYDSPYQVAVFNLSALGFGGQENTAKDYILQFVQEDYAAYSVTFTTTQPTSGQYSTIYMDDFSFEGGGVLGVACYDVGNQMRDDFGFVFVREFGAYASGNDLLKFSQYLANTVSHEAGHLFGLDHVSGNANLMQPVLNFNPVKLSFGSGTSEDSQSLLAANLGFPSGEADDFGNIPDTASVFDINQSVIGTLERRDDIDAFAIVAGATGQIILDIDTTQFGNLNSVLTVRDAGGTTIAFNDDDGGGPDSQLEFTAAAGETYTIFVSSAGGASSGTYTLHAITANGGSPAIFLTEEVGTADDLVLPFGAQVVGSIGFRTFTIANTGQGALVIDGLRVLGDDAFVLDSISQPGNSNDDITIAAGQSHAFTVSYSPTSSGNDSATVQIISNAGNEPTLTLELDGSATDPIPSQVEVDGQHRFSYRLNGDKIGVSLKGAGMAQVILSDDGTTIQEMNLFGTDATTNLKIKGSVTLNQVHGDGDLKSFTAPKVNLMDGQFNLTGQVGRLALHSIVQSDLHAIDIHRLSVSSLDRAHVRVDNALFSANVFGDMMDSTIESIGGQDVTGGIGSVKVEGIYSGSFISAGVSVDSIAAVLANTTSLTGSGRIGSVTLGTVDTTNAGVEFGVFSNGPITNVKVGSDRLSVPFVNDDFVVAILA